MRPRTSFIALYYSLSLATMAKGCCEMKDIVPFGSWDSHLHVFDPINYPYADTTRYFPPESTVEQLIATIPTRNFVYTMAGPDGTNATHMLDTIKELRSWGRDARGIVAIEVENIEPCELRRFHEGGVRSVRFNTLNVGDGVSELAETFDRAVAEIRNAGLQWSIDASILDYKIWHALIPTMRRLYKDEGTVFVTDHVFGAQPKDLDTPEFQDLLQVIDEGPLTVKISGLYRYNRTVESMLPMISEILKQRDGRGGVFGSDWPHVIADPGSTDLIEVDIPHHLEVLKGACYKIGNRCWEKLMRENAAALYA